MESIEKPRYIDLPSFSNSSMVGSVPSFHNEDSTFVGSNSMKLLPSPSILNLPPKKARASTGPRLSFLDRIHETALKGSESRLTSLLDTKNDELKQKNNTIRKLENENKKLKLECEREKSMCQKQLRSSAVQFGKVQRQYDTLKNNFVHLPVQNNFNSEGERDCVLARTLENTTKKIMPHQKGKIKARCVIGLIDRGDLFNSSEEAEKITKQKQKKWFAQYSHLGAY